MSLYAAIDLHSSNSVLAVLDDADKPLRQCRMPNDLPTGYIYPRGERAVRDLLRQRFVFVRQSVGVMQSVQSAWARHTGKCLSANAYRQLTDESLEQAFPDACVRLAVASQLQVWRNLEEQVRRVEKQILAMHAYQSERTALSSTPGIGRILGLTTTLETGDIGRFANAGHYVSYCRLVKSERLSNGKKKGHGNRKCGNKYLAWAWIEAANFAALARLAAGKARQPMCRACCLRQAMSIWRADWLRPAARRT